MKRIRSTNDRLVDVFVFDPKKNIKLQPVTPLMPLEALLIPVNLTDSDSDGINGGTGCNFIFLLCRLLVVGPVLKWLALLLCRLLVVGPVLKWLALLLCRLLVVGPVLKWLALCIYLFIYVFLRVHSPDQTVIYY